MKEAPTEADATSLPFHGELDYIFFSEHVFVAASHAASLGAVSGSLGGFYILGESWTGESECESNSKNRDQGLHDVFSLTLELSPRQGNARLEANVPGTPDPIVS
jgi:hypothetical protein